MDDSPLPTTTSSPAGSWLESDVLTRSASDPRGSDAAGRFDDAADNHLLVLAEGPGGARSVEMLGQTFRSHAEPVRERLRLAVAQTEPGVALAALILAPAPERRAFIFLAGAYRAYSLRADQLTALEPNPQIQELEFVFGDRFMLCSAAVSDAMPEARIAAVLRLSTPSVISHVLGNEAKKRGAHDDVSLAIVATYEPLEFGKSRPSDSQPTASDSQDEALLEPLDLGSIIDSELEECRAAMRERSLVVLKELDRDAPHVLVDEHQLRSAIRMLLDGVIRKVPTGGDLYLGSLRPASSGKGTCRVLLRFHGPEHATAGASAAELSAELAPARDLVEAMGGAFAIDASGGSAAVSIELPASPG